MFTEVVHTPGQTKATLTAAGDLLLLFGAPPATLPTRTADAVWQPAMQRGDWTLWSTRPDEEWGGAPLTTLETGKWRAWLVGELYGTAEPAPQIANVLQEAADPGSLNGHFLLIAYHDQSARWHVWTNRFATYHAYLAESGRRLALGTFFPAVATAAARPGLDWEGLTSFFKLGFFAGDRTFLRDVRQLRTATHLVLEADGTIASEERYWRWWFAPETTRSIEDTAVGFSQVFVPVMDELTRHGRVAVPISGGLDSRSTVAALARHRAYSDDIWGYSYGYDPFSIETSIARQIATARRMHFDAFTIQPYLFEELDQVLASVEGFQDVTQSRQAAIRKALRAHADAVIAAHWGDVWMGDLGLVGQAGMTSSDLADYAIRLMSKPGHAWLLDEICRPQLGNPQALLHQHVAEELQRVSHIEDPDYRLKAFKSDQWSARWTTASLRMFQAAVFPRLPFYDTRVAGFFATVPSTYVAGRRLQIEYLKRYAPDLARITWQQTGRDLYSDRETFLDLSRRAWRKGWRLLTGRQVIERNWEVQFLSDDGRRNLEAWLLVPGMALHEFVRPLSIQTLLETFYSDPLAEKRGYTISMLLTFSGWLERYGKEWI